MWTVNFQIFKLVFFILFGIYFILFYFLEGGFRLQFTLFFFPFIFIHWRLITLQYSIGFCHTLTWISHGFTCVPRPDPPSQLSPHPSLWVFPVHQPWAPVSCIQPGLVICFTLDSILVSMLFSLNIPPSPSPTESKVCSVHLCLFFCFAYRVIVTIFKIPYICISILYWCLSFWLTSLCIMGSSFIHLIRTDSNELFLMAE